VVLGRSRIVVALLLLASATTFAVGVAVERSGHHDASAVNGAAVGNPNAPEGSAAREAGEKNASAQATEAKERKSEQLFGVNTETNAVIGFVVATSLLLAIIAVVMRSPIVLAGVAVVALGAIAFDIREVLHQVDQSRTGVAMLAALTAALHVVIVVLATGTLFADRRGSQAGVAAASD
jgi:heme/copper-type cytochrome/quinol oxidase subunit 4